MTHPDDSRVEAFRAAYLALVAQYGLDFTAVLVPEMVGAQQVGVKAQLQLVTVERPKQEEG